MAAPCRRTNPICWVPLRDYPPTSNSWFWGRTERGIWLMRVCVCATDRPRTNIPPPPPQPPQTLRVIVDYLVLLSVATLSITFVLYICLEYTHCRNRLPAALFMCPVVILHGYSHLCVCVVHNLTTAQRAPTQRFASSRSECVCVCVCTSDNRVLACACAGVYV